MPEEPAVLACDACHATIYPEHLATHRAERVAGKLLCPHCLQEKRGGAQPAGTEAPAHDDTKPRVVAGPSAHIQTSTAVTRREVAYRRALVKGPTATRCRTFHCKLSDAAMAHLNEQLNEWVDAHDDVEIKFAVSSVGVVEGKSAEQHLVLTVFY